MRHHNFTEGLSFKQQETCAMFAVCRLRLRAEYRELDLFVSLKL